MDRLCTECIYSGFTFARRTAKCSSWRFMSLHQETIRYSSWKSKYLKKLNTLESSLLSNIPNKVSSTSKRVNYQPLAILSVCPILRTEISWSGFFTKGISPKRRENIWLNNWSALFVTLKINLFFIGMSNLRIFLSQTTINLALLTLDLLLSTKIQPKVL